MARKERNIFKRNDGRYEARYIKGYDENGKALYGAVYAQTYSAVKEKRDNLILPEQLPELNKPPCSERLLVVEVEDYINSIKHHVKPSTHGVYLRYLEHYISPHFRKVQCSQLTEVKLQRFVDKLSANGLAAMTVQSIFCFLKNGLKGAVSQDVFDVKLPKRINNEVEILSAYEQKRLESAARTSGNIDHISVILCLYTGIRIGELCGLLWEDIDFDRGLLYVRRTVQRIKDPDRKNKTKIVCLTPKSCTSRRAIPLPGFLIELLREHKEQNNFAYVITRTGSHLEPRTIQYRFKSLLSSANIKQINFHALRHTFATRALENGFDIKTLSEILGHSSATITLNKYAHTLSEHKRKSMESLAFVYH